MCAKDTDLLPPGSFTDLLREYCDHLDVLPDALESLWTAMDSGGFSPALKARVPCFNGSLFHDRSALPRMAEQFDLLLDAPASDWSNEKRGIAAPGEETAILRVPPVGFEPTTR